MDYSTPAGDDYHRVRHQDILSDPRLMRAWGQYAIVTYFSEVKPLETVLEIGAGTGINIAELSKIRSVEAIEPSQFARSHCAAFGVKVYSDWSELVPSQKYDWILLRHVLEHVPEPKIFLENILGLLKARGRLIVVVPCEDAFSEIREDDINHHLHCWNRQTLSNLLKQSGFDVVSDRVNWYNGRRLSYPILQIFGPEAYRRALTAIGRMTRSAEIIVTATKR
ncbi:class I SAM-dependent methyltransferase [Bradyrhizobium sp. CCBAU 45321]|uniref:class I SAM-dependent methyltransferase n=1 Tax=Bradyrhizobium sp. CCBAU 45321 TaxID=1641878 RepID=UPI00230201C5|nr:class I SAM-dependent methyltransferase [Bradyrhizobium sp. CCBAU 45321]